MTVPVEDSNTTTAPIATPPDAGNPVPVYATALVVDGVALPVGPANPLPVAGQVSVASDGSGRIACGYEA